MWGEERIHQFVIWDNKIIDATSPEPLDRTEANFRKLLGRQSKWHVKRVECFVTEAENRQYFQPKKRKLDLASEGSVQK